MQKKSVYWHSYHIPERRDTKLNRIRDGAAFAELASIFLEREYFYGGILLNFPAQSGQREGPDEYPPLTPDSLLIQPTRPPLDDFSGRRFHKLFPSRLWLERKIFTILRGYFRVCSRGQIWLADQLVIDKLRQPTFPKTNINFDAYGWRYIGVGGIDGTLSEDIPDCDQGVTATYLLYLTSADVASTEWENPPNLLIGFGINGVATLIWSYLLRTRFRDKYFKDLTRSFFVMAEIALEDVPPPPLPMSLDFAANLEVRELLFEFV